MRLRELIVLEDGEGGATAGATTSADIATVAYPLFVRGATRKQKRKNARAAVGQRYVPGPAYIGQGVFEGVAEGLNEDAARAEAQADYMQGQCMILAIAINQLDPKRYPIGYIWEYNISPGAPDIQLDDNEWNDLSPDEQQEISKDISRHSIVHAYVRDRDTNEYIDARGRHKTLPNLWGRMGQTRFEEFPGTARELIDITAHGDWDEVGEQVSFKRGRPAFDSLAGPAGVKRAQEYAVKYLGVEGSKNKLRIGNIVRAVVDGKRVQGEVIGISSDYKQVELWLSGVNDFNPITVNARDIEPVSEQSVAEGSTDDDTAKTAYMYGLRHGREGVGNNMDRAKAEWGDNFKYYNAGFLKGRNQTAKSLKAAGQGVAEGSEDDIEDTRQFRNAIALAKSQKAIRQAKDGKNAKYYADGTKVTPDEIARRAAERTAKKQGMAEGSENFEGVLWRVEYSEATGRFSVVKGYNQHRKTWKNKFGAGDFNQKQSAEDKAAELNKGVGEDSLNEFAPGAGDDGGGEDPYKYPKPERYRRSADYFGQFEADHFDREDFDDATGVFKGYWGRTPIAYFKFDNPARTGGDDPGMGWYYEPESDGNGNNTGAAPAVDRPDGRKQQELGMINAFLKSGNRPSPGSQIYQLMKKHGMAEGSLEDRLKKYVRPTVKTTPKIERTTNPAGRTTDHVEWKVTGPLGDVSRFTSKKAAQAHYDSFGMVEAHVLNHDNVIYRLDKENPMSDTEVAVLGGAGRYSLKGLRDKARKEAAALAQDLSIEHGGAFRRSAENIKQLTNTINTIVAAYNELARLRRRGGRGSRGITDEDANFIRECIRVVEQATQNYRLMEGLTQEPDSTGFTYKQIGGTHSQPEIHKGRKE